MELSAETRSLVILHSNDFHGHIKEEKKYAGAAKIGAVIKHLRSQRKDLLVMDAGDAVSGTPVSTLFRGVPIFEVMSEMGYDLGNLGNHEFDYGYQQISKFRKAASFPLLNANAYGPKGRLLGDKAVLTLTINKIKVGVIGLITDDTLNITTPSGNANLQFLPPLKVLKTLLPSLRAKSDLVILLSHLGYEADVKLALEVDGIDLIVGGHSHTLLESGKKVKNTYLVQAHEYGTHLGKLELTVDTDADEITSLHSSLIPASRMLSSDVDIQNLVRTWEQKVKRQVEFEIAQSSGPMDGKELRQLLEQIMARTARTELAYYNKGGIRDTIPQGRVTARHIWNIEPFGNSLVTMQLKGKHFKQLLLREQEDRPDIQSLDDETEYLIATNNFVAAHALRSFEDKVTVTNKDLLIRDILIDHIRREGLP